MDSTQRTINAETRTSIMNQQRQDSSQSDADLEDEIKWQLLTLMCSAGSYFFFFSLLSITLQREEYVACSVGPLILYDIVKIIFCSRRLYKEWDIENKDDLKDIIECVFMTLYKIGVIIKLSKTDVDCTYLIAPVTINIITRIVLSMGIYKEVNGIYKIVNLWLS